MDVLQFTVTIRQPPNVFELDEESIAKSIVDSLICQSKKGSLVVQYDDNIMTVISIPSDNDLAMELLKLCDSYIRADRCLSRRSKELSIKQQKIRQALNWLQKLLEKFINSNEIRFEDFGPVKEWIIEGHRDADFTKSLPERCLVL